MTQTTAPSVSSPPRPGVPSSAVSAVSPPSASPIPQGPSLGPEISSSSLLHSLPSMNEPDSPEVYGEVVAGLVIPYTECREWFKRMYNVYPKEDYSDNLTIMWDLMDIGSDHDDSDNVIAIPSQDESVVDFMFVTQSARGPFRGLKDIMKPGEKEEEVRELLSREIGIAEAVFKCILKD